MKYNYRILKNKKFVNRLERFYKYDGWETRYNHYLRVILIENIIKTIKKRGTALDIGCSAGAHSFLLEKAGFDVVGIDLSEKGIKDAKVWAKEIRSSCKFEIGDATHLKYDNDSFDLVIASEVLEHIPKNKKAVKEIFRITKKGGFIIYTLPNGKSRYWQRKKRELKRRGKETDLRELEVGSNDWNIMQHMKFSPKMIRKITSDGLELKELLSLSCGHMVPPLSIILRVMMATDLGYKYEISNWENKNKKEDGATFVIMYKKT